VGAALTTENYSAGHRRKIVVPRYDDDGQSCVVPEAIVIDATLTHRETPDHVRNP
jgi:hypothetical protein